jgi:competence protein ComGA
LAADFGKTNGFSLRFSFLKSENSASLICSKVSVCLQFSHRKEAVHMYEIETLSDRLIDEACKLRASDIHIVPREHDAVVHYRIDDELIRMKKIKREETHRLISHFKFLASMDIGERRKPQNGSLSVKREKAIVYLRLSTLPTVYDESLVIRILPHERVPPLKTLSLFPSSTAKILSLLNHSHGLMIFTGPTDCVT